MERDRESKDPKEELLTIPHELLKALWWKSCEPLFATIDTATILANKSGVVNVTLSEAKEEGRSQVGREAEAFSFYPDVILNILVRNSFGERNYAAAQQKRLRKAVEEMEKQSAENKFHLRKVRNFVVAAMDAWYNGQTINAMMSLHSLGGEPGSN